MSRSLLVSRHRSPTPKHQPHREGVGEGLFLSVASSFAVEHGVDSLAVHDQHIAHHRDLPRLVAQKARHRAEVAGAVLVLLDLDPERRGHILQVRHPLELEGPVRHQVDVVHFDLLLLVVALVVDLAHDLLEDVLQGDHARGAPVLVHHDGHVQPPLPHLLQHRLHPHRLRDEVGRLHEATHFCGVVELWLHGVDKQVFGDGDSGDVVDVVHVHRDPRVLGAVHQKQKVAQRRVRLEGGDVDARSHDLGDAHVLEVEHPLDHLGLLGLDPARLLGPHDHEPELVLRDAPLVVPLESQHLHDLVDHELGGDGHGRHEDRQHAQNRHESAGHHFRV
mmetsp:Transcript_29694/g.66594  ORF Transcript_29694/g.66594 Transcript_29694/m.66594 type:complete len:334 (-) Transcript_29694:838-1839(-)